MYRTMYRQKMETNSLKVQGLIEASVEERWAMQILQFLFQVKVRFSRVLTYHVRDKI